MHNLLIVFIVAYSNYSIKWCGEQPRGEVYDDKSVSVVTVFETASLRRPISESLCKLMWCSFTQISVLNKFKKNLI